MTTGKNRYVYAAAATIVLLLAGMIYAWSILNAPFQTEFGWSPEALGLNFTLTMGAFCAGIILGGFLLKRISLRIIIIGSGLLVCAGFSITGKMSGNNILVLYLAYGICCGLGIGTVYNALISSIMGWFPDKRATISGILMMGFGASNLVFGLVAGTLLDLLGWRNLFIAIGLTILAVFTVCSFLIKAYVPPKPTETKADQSNDYTTRQVMRLPSFWRFYTFEIFIAAIGACVISMARTMSIFIGTTEALAIMLVGVLSVFNGIGRIITGMLFDKKGNIFTIRTSGVLALLTPLFLLLASWTNQIALLIPGIITAGLSFGSTPVMASAFVGKNYGMKHFPVNFSIAATFLFIASFSATIGGWLYGFAGGYNAVFVFLAVLGVLGVIMGETLKKV